MTFPIPGYYSQFFCLPRGQDLAHDDRSWRIYWPGISRSRSGLEAIRTELVFFSVVASQDAED